jgi:hypothetical protein
MTYELWSNGRLVSVFTKRDAAYRALRYVQKYGEFARIRSVRLV